MPYVIFNGVNSSTITGMIIEALPDWKVAKHRQMSESPAGFDGRIYGNDAPYDIYQATIRVSYPASVIDAVNAYFNGEGWMIASNDPNKKVYCRIIAESQPRHYPAGDLSTMFTLECMPFRYITPDPADIVVNSSGATINNTGTAYSLPRVTIVGSGDFNVTIGSETVFFESVPSGGIVVDAELMDAISSDGAQLLNDCMDGEPWKIQPGENLVSWTGNVSKITITPRWRCY